MFHRHRSRSPFLRLFAGFAVVFVSFSEERAGSCTSQDMHEIHSDADNFLHKTWLCSFSYQDVSPLLENILRQQAGFSLSLYMLSSFTFWKRHHVAVNTLICFTCHAVFRIWSSCNFLQVIRTSEIWEHCFTLLWIQISPHDVTTDFPIAVIFPTRFFIRYLNCNFQFKLRFLHLLPSLTVFLQPCHLGSLGVSHHGTTGEMTKISIRSTVIRHCNIQKLWLPIHGSQPALFTTRMFPLVCSFTEQFSLPIQLLFCRSMRWPCFHLSEKRIENPATPAFLPFDIVDRFFFPQSGSTSCH